MGAFDDLAKTTNLKLNKPGLDNVADIEALNENFDIIDEVLTPGALSLYVDANAAEGGDGTESKPFKTVQEAVDIVKHAVLEVNILIKPGTYDEDVAIFSKPTKVMYIKAQDATNKPSIKSFTIHNTGIVALTNLKIHGLNSKNTALEIGYTNINFNGLEIMSNGIKESKAVLLHATNGIIYNTSITDFTHGIYVLYGTCVEVVRPTFTGNTVDMMAEGGIILYSDATKATKEGLNGGFVLDRSVGEALTKDLYAVLIAENTFRNRALASAMSNVINTLFVETFTDTNDIDKTIGDGAKVANYHDVRAHSIEKTDNGTITLYTTSEIVNTGNNKVWMYADYTLNGGTINFAISRDGGAHYTVVAETVLNDITATPTGNTMKLRITIIGAVTLRNVAWGCK